MTELSPSTITLGISIGIGLVLLIGLLALRAFLHDARAQVVVTRSVLLQREDRQTWLRRLEVALARTGPGIWVRRELATAGLKYPLWSVALVALVLTITVPWLLWVFVAPALAILGVLAAWFGLRSWLGAQRTRYRNRFVDQIPDLARVLSNATNAGLSIRTAWNIAEQEMGEPARSEIARINTAVRFGATLEDAMLQVEDRLPSREVKVLMSTLVIASRSGGSLVAALRDISYMLDERKETKREIRSVLAQSVATGYTLIGIGVGLLLLMNVIMPGTIERMTQNIFGQIALLVGSGLMVLGWYFIRKITKVDL